MKKKREFESENQRIQQITKPNLETPNRKKKLTGKYAKLNLKNLEGHIKSSINNG